MGKKQLLIFANLLIILGAESKLPETCLLPKVSGNIGRSCDAQLTMYYFNAKTYKCQKFLYNGCGGNANQYSSLEECEAKCPLTEEEKAKQDNYSKIQKSSYLDNPLLQTSAVALRNAVDEVKSEDNQTAVTNGDVINQIAAANEDPTSDEKGSVETTTATADDGTETRRRRKTTSKRGLKKRSRKKRRGRRHGRKPQRKSRRRRRNRTDRNRKRRVRMGERSAEDDENVAKGEEDTSVSTEQPITSDTPATTPAAV